LDVIDLTDLDGLCAGLSAESAGPLAHRATVALERRHRSGVHLAVAGDADLVEEVRWNPLPATVAAAEDQNEATRDGAMGIALALAHRHRRWRVVRRLQSVLSEGADWLLEDQAAARFALEVKGTDEGPLLISEALLQARESIWARRATPAACVVRFREPRAILQVDEPR
jgi:hypothetical protein